MINLEKVCFSYGKTQILHDIDLNIGLGEKVAIIGHNGAGKSTLVDIIVNVKKPSKGKIKYTELEKGQTIKDVLGVQFQNKDFPVGLKLKHLLKFHLSIYGLNIKDEKIQKLLKEYNLETRLNVEMKKLSGGQKQKFNIMMAIINNPKLLVVDEVLTGLDITSQEGVISSLESKLKDDKNLTFITVSHSPMELKRLVDRLIVLSNGKKIYDDSVKNIEMKHKSLDLFLESLVEHD